jgi:anti-sigma factor RsiW
MNRELELKLQAWVDGELSEREAREVAERLERDREAQALVAELRLTKGFLTGNEPEATLPESRDFYWSKIHRSIEQTEREEVALKRRFSWTLAWRRLLVPLSGVALVILVTAISLNFFPRRSVEDALANLVEVENPSEHIGSISYRSPAENMFVVWLYDKESDTEPKSDMPELMDDMTIQ